MGATRGAVFAFIEWMLEGKSLLWGDTIQANIRRYVERYFLPELRDTPHRWRQQDLILEVGPGHTDFRSADRPERWEGFGYDVIFLNEAGIILDDPYLYYNAVLPMMMDNPSSSLIAAGTPKLSQMRGVLFKELWDKAQTGERGYHGRRFTTYDNPHLDETAIKALEAEISPAERPQEIGGEFITPDGLGSFFKRAWFHSLVEAPPCVRIMRGWDFAATEPHEGNHDPDWTVGVKLGVTQSGGLVVLDVVMDRKGPGGVDTLLAQTAQRDGPQVTHIVPVDPGAAGKTAARHFRQHPLKGHSVSEYPQTRQQGGKATRATPVSVAASEQRIGYLAAPWNEWFFSQLEPFPNPKVHDDVVDALAAAYNALASGQHYGGIVVNEGGLS